MAKFEGAWLAIALICGCGFHVGKPYNVGTVHRFAVGQTTSHDVRQALGAPFKASPLRYTAAEAERKKLKCPDVAESWTYEYTAAGNACRTMLEFDTNGVLCTVSDTPPALGPQCHGEE